MNKEVTLYLLPNVLTEEVDHQEMLAKSVDQVVAGLDHLIAEDEKQARRYLKRFSYPFPKTFRDVEIHLLNEHTLIQEKQELIEKIKQKGNWGLISDCGMPCIADPGADLVLMARKEGIKIKALSGPSSVLLALVLSGLSGQSFTFHGYLPKEPEKFISALKLLEKRSKQEGSTHLFIETPYRNEQRLKAILSCLQPTTWLSIACDLTSLNEFVETHQILNWKKKTFPSIDKRPCLFVIRS